MKKYTYLIIGILIFMLTGCSKEDQMTNFIPTPIVTPEPDRDEDATNEPSEEEPSEEEPIEGTEPTTTPARKPAKTGKTTPKYVKLGSYDAVLNVRAEPSLQGAIVGFLVHAEKVEVLTFENGWASFVMGDEVRYVSADFLVDQRPAYFTPPTPKPKPTEAPSGQAEAEQDPNREPPGI